MIDTPSLKVDPQAFVQFIRAQGLALHAKDQPPPTRKDWEGRRAKLRAAMFQATGPFPDKPSPLEPKVTGVLKREGYRIEKLIFQSRPDVWVTASAYVPETAQGKVPAVLVVHGHWPWARRDPVVQARSLGLVKLGFFVLAVDAFGAGERYPEPARGTYHGALFGSTLWPAGQTLLGMQVYDNRRAVDYLRTRPEVDGDRLGITGASGGGNQSMYAGALDERFRAVVPVCSVGTYQAYLHAACCVCEVLPGALRFAEEGDVLALVAPRALMVVNATRDAFQFSVGEAEKSVARARTVFRLYGQEEKLRHAIFDSGHDYNQAMREAMYGWMTKWLKNEGEGKPIPEPKHTVETPEDLRALPVDARPKGFLFPPTFAAREAERLLAKFTQRKPDHPQEWESSAVFMRDQLRRQIFGDFPKLPRPVAKMGKPDIVDQITTTTLLLQTEPGLSLPAVLKSGVQRAAGRQPACVLLHLDGKAEAVQHPLVAALLAKGWAIVAPDLRATGETRPSKDAIGGAPDHHRAEHALWIGRPLLGQWVFDVLCLLDWCAFQPSLDPRRFAVVGLGQAGIVALCAAGLFEDRVTAAGAFRTPTSYVTQQAYPPGTSMGLLAPGILRLGDIPQLAALVAPRRLILAEGVTSQGKKLTEQYLREAYAFTRDIYKLYKADAKLTVTEGGRIEDIAAGL
jgi:dienelactone hydrolase